MNLPPYPWFIDRIDVAWVGIYTGFDYWIYHFTHPFYVSFDWLTTLTDLNYISISQYIRSIGTYTIRKLHPEFIESIESSSQLVYRTEECKVYRDKFESQKHKKNKWSIWSNYYWIHLFQTSVYIICYGVLWGEEKSARIVGLRLRDVMWCA